MSTFDSTKTQLNKLLDDITDGKIQLPDFQRGWVWDDEHIRALLVSIAREFPIGAVMLLEVGGETRFQVRPIEGVELSSSGAARVEQLILDGQQRLTSLTQVIKLAKPVTTQDEKKREILRHYYFDIERALAGADSLADAIVAVDESKTVKGNFGRGVVLDLSDEEKEFEKFCFPCTQIMKSDAWEYGLMRHDHGKMPRFMEFRAKILEPFRNYTLPVIALKKDTKREAVCLVFEKVNTGGVPLSVFELVTATWAADAFNLRDDWYGGHGQPSRQQRLVQKPLLRSIEPTDFLQGISLLYSWERREAERRVGKSGKELPAVTAKRENVLEVPLAAYRQWADPLTAGFLEAEAFLRGEGFYQPKFLPYRSQIVPLAAVLTHLGERWMEPQIKDKLSRWFWCGVLGELYGSASETRIALDVAELLSWVRDASAPEPSTVRDAGFQPNRLDTLRSRTSAAYRGLYVLLQRQGAKDLFWKARMVDLDRDERKIDIHHIFPKKWCEDEGISPRVYNAIVNKTAISYKANRMIGGKAPSDYLAQLQRHASVQASNRAMDDILQSHKIAPEELRADNFEQFYKGRKQALLELIAAATGKAIAQSDEYVPEDSAADESDDEEGGSLMAAS